MKHSDSSTTGCVNGTVTNTINSTMNSTAEIDISASFNSVTVSVLTAYGILLVSGVVGNSLVIKWFLPQKNAPGSKLVIALAVTDLVSSILMPFMGTHSIISNTFHPGYTWPKWFLDGALCHVMYGLPLVFVSVSAWILVTISVERYR